MDEDQEEEEPFQSPDDLLYALESGNFEVDPLIINYELKRMIYDPDITCEDFVPLFESLLSLLSDSLYELTTVLYPEFCNWIEILLDSNQIKNFTTTEFYKFHEEIMIELSEDTCNPCIADFSAIWDNFYKEAEHRYSASEHSVRQKIHLASLLRNHDELAEILTIYDEKYKDDDESSDDVADYLDLVDIEKIMDPVLKRLVKELIQEEEW